MQSIGAPRLQHVMITFPQGQEEVVRVFYQGLLGFREKPAPEVAKPLGWIWFDTGSAGVELHLVPSPRPVDDDPEQHFCIQVDDLEEYRARLEGAGLQIQSATALPFRPRFFTRDPFRNRIEVVQVTGDYLLPK